MRRTPLGLILIASLALVAAGCDIGSGSVPSDDTGDLATPIPTIDVEAPGSEPDTTSAPVETGATEPQIAGFDGWKLLNASDVDIGATEDGFAMTLLRKALWFDTQQGVLFYSTIDGNFRLSATVSTSKTSDSSSDPGGGGVTMFAGLMARSETARENYVFVVTGVDGHGLAVETKSTLDGHSSFEQPAWPSGDADLELCRIGTAFTLWKRPLNSDLDYALAAKYDRPDLKGTIEVGANIYADGTPDITAQFSDLSIEPLDPGEAC